MKKRSALSRIFAILLALVLCANFVLIPGQSNVAEAATTQAPYRNVVYYGEWSIYAGQKYFYPSYIDGSYITHLNFAFLDVDKQGNLVLCDEHADFLAILPEQSGITYGEPYAGVLGALAILREKYPNMKIGISVGGWTRSGDFPAMAANATTRQNFARNIAKFVDYLGYDFVDIDWEYPGADRDPDPQGNGVTIDKGCKGGPEDKVNFTLLMQAIRDELDALGAKNGKYYELSCAMSASPTMMAMIEYDKVMEIVDFANMMTYDLCGAWAPYTGHQTGLYVNPNYDPATQPDGVFSVDTCVQYLKDTYGNKIDYTKVVIGVAPYTRGWAGVQNDGRDPANPGLFATAEPNSVKAADGVMSGTFSQTDLPMLISQYQLKEYYDETAQAAYYYSPTTGYFFTCDNARSIAAKGAYVKENGLGGLISWMASLDATNSLTRTMKESLYGSASLPAQEIITANPSVSLTISASGSTYTFTLKNNETVNEGSNVALKDAELFKETITFPKLYIKSASGATFSAGSQAGSVTNQNGYGVIDLSGIYAAKSMKPGTSHTFTVNVSGTADVSDIVSVSMTQRILTSLSESQPQVIYGSGSGNVPTDPPVTNPPATNPPATNPPVTEPPVTEPPVTEPPATEPPVTEPSGIPAWNSSTAYTGGTQVSYNGSIWEAKWWTQGDVPGASEWGPWKLISSGTVEPPVTEPPVTEPPVTEPPVTNPPVTNPPVTEPPVTNPPATGSYKAWASGTAYKLGDLVSYNGKVYECIYAHTSHGGWLPDGTPTLWKLRTDLVAGGTTEPEVTDPIVTEPPVTEPEGPVEIGSTAIPQHMVTGYWHNFCNGSTNLKLSDVPSYYDMICVAFTGNTTTPGEVTFELDKDLANAVGGYTKAQFIQDIKTLQAKGQHVIISVGGAEGRIEINSEAAAQTFATTLIKIIEEYGFEGVDIDLEGSAVSGVNYIAGALRTVHDHFGDDFIITMAPETYYLQAARLSSNDITTSYLRLALQIKDILTICYPQFYNSGSMPGYGGSIVSPGTAEFITSQYAMLVEAGLRPDQLAIGVPATSRAAGSGYISTDLLSTAVRALANGTSSGSFTAPKAYPTIRGVMTWSINWDATQNYAWAKAMASLMDSLPVVEGGNTNPEPPVTEPPVTEPPVTEPPVTEPPVTEPPVTEPPVTEPPVTEPPVTEPPVTEPPVTEPSGIPAWDSKTAYTGGAQVTYNGSVWEAKWWTQGDVPGAAEWGPWKLISSGTTNPPATEPPVTEPPVTEPPVTNPPVTEPPVTNPPVTEPSVDPIDPEGRVLPDHLVVGYWHNFCNGSTNLKLSDVPDYYDMVCVAFTGNTATAGQATFEIDKDLAAAVGGYTKAEFIQDINDMKANGQFVIISVGGAEGRISITSTQAAQTFANSMIGIIEEYGFDGIDIDLEGGAVSGTAYIASALRTLHDHFGDDFIITMAPETAYVQNAQGSYLKLALDIKDILTICFPQFYNSGTMIGYDGMPVSLGTADFITSQLTTIVESGLRDDQVGIGLPCVRSAAGSGYIETDVIERAVTAFVTGTAADRFVAPQAYPGLRCMMTWSINWDATNGYAWGKAMSDLMDRVDELEPPTPSEEEIAGTTTWEASRAYNGGDEVLYNGKRYRAKWWTQGDVPGASQWGPWERV